jgi:hypothetical protein
LNKKITAVDDNNNIIAGGKVLESGNPDNVNVAIYDSTGNIVSYTTVRPEMNMDSVYEFSINQHFYFDTSKQVLYSEVNYINVYRNVVTSQGLYLGRTFYFRVYLVAPSLYRKPKVNRFLN